MPAVDNEILDIRQIPPAHRHSHIFKMFDALEEGASFVLSTDHDPKPLLLLFQHDRPSIFDWSPLEEGPEVWRIRISRRPPAAGGRSVSEYLAWDHDRLDTLLQGARASLKSGEPAAAVRQFSEFHTGLLRHIRMEEEVLFPAFEKATGLGEAGPTAVMRLEHREIQRILERMRAVCTKGAPALPAFTALHAELLSVLTDHNVKEENVVYPLTDQTHSPSLREEVIRQMQVV